MITIFDSKFIKAYQGAPMRQGRLQPGQSRPLTALKEEYSTDAHFALYRIPGHTSCFRHAKASLRAFHDAPESTPVIQTLAFDIDLPGHRAWTDAGDSENRQFLESVFNAVPRDVREGMGYYATRGGLRLLVQLKHAVPVTHADSLISQALDHLNDVPGLDRSCKDWTRLFRLPYTVRDGELQNWNHILPLALPKGTASWEPSYLVAGATPAPGMSFEGPVPEFDSRPKKPTLTDLKNVPENWKRILHKGHPIETRASRRHAAIVECAVAVSHAVQPQTPHELFDMMKASVAAMGDTFRFWPEAWKVCQWVVSHCLAQKEEERRADEEASLEAQGAVARLAEILDVSHDIAQKSLLLSSGRVYWVWNVDSEEYVGPFGEKDLPAAFRNHLTDFIPADSTLKQALIAIGSVVPNLRYHYKGGTHYNVKEQTLRVCMAKPNHPEPVFHQDVHDYLSLWGPKMLAYCSQIWNTDVPCAALYLVAKPGAGKSLLATALSGAAGGHVTFEDTSGNFNDQLRESWIIWADEAVELPRDKSPANILRKLLGASVWGINVKYQDTSRLEGYLRVVITANNSEVLRFNGALSSDDIAALAERVIYVNPSKEAQEEMEALLWRLRSEYAESKGFKPTDPRAPNYLDEVWRNGNRFLEHCAWLEENYEFERGRRFIVTGEPSVWSNALRTRHGAQAAVIEAIVRAATSKGAADNAVEFRDGLICVNMPNLNRAWAAVSNEPKPNANWLEQSLRTLSGGNKSKLRVNGSRVNYWCIPASDLVDSARSMGMEEAERLEHKIKKENLKNVS